VAWTLFAVSKYPEVEARITAELDSLGLLASPAQPSPRELELDDLHKLPYLDAVIKESMRLYHVGAPEA
jgi:cytochrome P450